MSRETGQPGQGRLTTFHESELKICDLCGWLNLDSNAECFVCGWRGHFEHDQEMVRAALDLATRRYGRLELQHLTNPHAYHKPEPADWKSRMRDGWRRFCGWLRGKSA